MVTLVTSLNRRLYEQYGRAMIQTFEACSSDVKLMVVFEGEQPADRPDRHTRPGDDRDRARVDGGGAGD